MIAYCPISDYAIIGNGYTTALVNRAGSVDWCCLPRFDSEAVFCRLLDAERGGFFEITPTESAEVTRRYLDHTNILQTTFTTDTGVLRLTDFMPAPEEDEGWQSPHCILRGVECLEGEVDVRARVRPTFRFARGMTQLDQSTEGWTANQGGDSLEIKSAIPLHAYGETLIGTCLLNAGERRWLMGCYGGDTAAQSHLTLEDADLSLDQTRNYWEKWADVCDYDGPYRELVLRSALTLKLLIYKRTGGLVAAPTTSLPDDIGGKRNWDYRFNWLRDAGMLLDALQQLNYHEESERFFEWLEQHRLKRHQNLHVVYRLDGEPAPDETPLPHLEGYRQSHPVQVGNGATNQEQIDVYGHVLDAVYLCFTRMPREMSTEFWQFLTALTNKAADGWRKPDHGPWEMRGAAQHYVYSKVFCWVALDRAIRLSQDHHHDGNVAHWKEERERLRETIESEGFDDELGAFKQAFHDTSLDAAALTIPLVNFLPATDPRVRSTMQKIERELGENGLLYRYRRDDGLPGHDSTFTLCGFWMVMNLAKAGEGERARERFEKLCRFANDVGLMSEQIDSESGELRGNFPQGFSHVGLIRAAIALRDAQQAGE